MCHLPSAQNDPPANSSSSLNLSVSFKMVIRMRVVLPTSCIKGQDEMRKWKMHAKCVAGSMARSKNLANMSLTPSFPRPLPRSSNTLTASFFKHPLLSAQELSWLREQSRAESQCPRVVPNPLEAREGARHPSLLSFRKIILHDCTRVPHRLAPPLLQQQPLY